MTDKDKHEFAAIMAGLAENFGTTLTKAGLRMRFEALKQYSIEQVRNAAISILRTRKYLKMPTIAEFIEHLEGGSAEDIAQVEAAKVLEAIKVHGPYRSVVFDNPVTQAVIEYSFGGWTKLAEDLDAKGEKWFFKDFERAYGAFARQGVKLGGTLLGICDHANQLIGHKKSEPVYIGNQEKARQVRLMGSDAHKLTGSTIPTHIALAMNGQLKDMAKQ